MSNTNQKIVIFTSDHVRHKYVARRIVDEFGDVVKKIYFEGRTYVPREKGKNEEETKILDLHFDLRDQMEEKYFAPLASQGFRDVPTRNCGYNDLSQDKILREVQEINPDVLVVYGTSIIRDNVIESFSGKIINMHLGLSPYYRGSGTNFFPLYYDEPEYVGVTIHFLDRGIDTGEIIHHARPMFSLGDNQHSIGCKSIIAGTDKLIQAVGELLSHTIVSFPQWKEGEREVCLRKDFTPDKVAKLKTMLDNGFIEKYLERKEKVENIFKLIP